MNSYVWRRLLLLTLIGALSPSVARAQSALHYYRYELLTRSQEFIYVKEVPADARGTHHAIETDAEGRITRAAVMRGGKKISERVYSFAAGEKAPAGYETFTGSEQTGRVRIQRNADGARTRDDSFTVTGAPTGYTQYSYRADSVEAASYTSDGKKGALNVSFYSLANILTRTMTYSNPDDHAFHVDSELDDLTGLRKGSTQIEGGSLSSSSLFNYDDDGDLIRQDVFDPAGEWFAAAEFSDGLPIRRVYGSSKELRYGYDETRRIKETKLFFEDMFICRFTYDRLPDGTTKRTLAFGPDGDLWAEYPDMEIVDVRQNGHPINGRAAIINKTGNWY